MRVIILPVGVVVPLYVSLCSLLFCCGQTTLHILNCPFSEITSFVCVVLELVAFHLAELLSFFPPTSSYIFCVICFISPFLCCSCVFYAFFWILYLWLHCSCVPSTSQRAVNHLGKITSGTVCRANIRCSCFRKQSLWRKQSQREGDKTLEGTRWIKSSSIFPLKCLSAPLVQ